MAEFENETEKMKKFRETTEERAREAKQLYQNAVQNGAFDVALASLKLAWRMEDRAAGRASLDDYT